MHPIKDFYIHRAYNVMAIIILMVVPLASMLLLIFVQKHRRAIASDNASREVERKPKRRIEIVANFHCMNVMKSITNSASAIMRAC